MRRLIVVAAVCTAGLFAQSFDVASIKPSPPGSRGVAITPPAGGRFRATNITLAMLIRTAYEVEDFQISGGPKWIGTESFDVEAKAEGNPDLKQIRLMLQNLLTDRFKLAIHDERKELPMYLLRVAKGAAERWPAKMSLRRRLPESSHQSCSAPCSIRPASTESSISSYHSRRRTSPEKCRAIPTAPRPIKLDSQRSQVEILVIDRAEKPSEN